MLDGINNVDPSNMLSDEIKDLLRVEVKPKSVPSKSLIDIKSDFLQDGSEFWSKVGKRYLSAYDKGELISNYNTVSPHDHASLFKGLIRLIKETISEDLSEKEVDLTEIKDAFGLLEYAFKVLSSTIEFKVANTEKKTPIDIILLFSALHGFINSYVQKNANGK